MGTIPDPAQLGVSVALGGVSTAMHGAESRSLMDYQNDLYRQNLADQRAYDDPSAVMARYRRAGLNPDLLLGQGASMSSGSAPMGALGSSGSPDFDGHLAAVSAASLNNAQEENIRANTKLMEKQSEDIDSQIEYREFEKGIKKILTDNNVKITDAQVANLANQDKKIAEEIYKLIADKGVAEAEKALKEQQKAWNDKTEDLRIKEIKAHIRMMNFQADVSDEQAKEISKLVDARYDLLIAQTSGEKAKAAGQRLENESELFDALKEFYRNPELTKVYNRTKHGDDIDPALVAGTIVEQGLRPKK